MSAHISIHLNHKSVAPVVRFEEFDSFARVEIACDGVALGFFLATSEQAAHIADGFNRAFPKPLAEAAE